MLSESSTDEGAWQVDDDLWSTGEGERVTDPRQSDPWYTVDSQLVTKLDVDELADDDFSRLSKEQCSSLIASSSQSRRRDESQSSTSTSVNHAVPLNTHTVASVKPTGEASGFEIDQNYLSKLERKLERLYKLSGKAERKSMLKQVSDRAEVLFVTDGERQDTFTGEPLTINPVSKLLHPQQALTAEEKLVLLKCDHLDKQSADDHTDYHSTDDHINEQSTDGQNDNQSTDDHIDNLSTGVLKDQVLDNSAAHSNAENAISPPVSSSVATTSLEGPADITLS